MATAPGLATAGLAGMRAIVVPNVHRFVGRRELLRRGPGLQSFPGRLELRLGRVEVLGRAPDKSAGQMDGDASKPDGWHVFVGEADPADALPAFEYRIVIGAVRAELQHISRARASLLALHAGLQLGHRRGPLPGPRRTDDLLPSAGAGSGGRAAAGCRADHRRAIIPLASGTTLRSVAKRIRPMRCLPSSTA
jgi:hypothetical protein